jgi:RNA polymerase sigma-70 factor (ECF subfamily)
VTTWVAEAALTFPIPLEPSAAAQTRGTGVEAVVSAARAGDHRAFEAIYRAHVGRVYALARRLAQDATHADELTQDVFVRAWERLASFRGDSSFGTWLHRLAINVILSDRRSAWRREQRVSAGGDLVELETRARSAAPSTRIDLEAAIGRLPPGARTVFVLHDVEGYQHQEISTMTGIAVGTSKAQLFRARRLLREALER